MQVQWETFNRYNFNCVHTATLNDVSVEPWKQRKALG